MSPDTMRIFGRSAGFSENAPAGARKCLKLAERTGLEPATPGVTGRYSNQLNYRSSG